MAHERRWEAQEELGPYDSNEDQAQQRGPPVTLLLGQ
jgi:hypothetical protein